MADAYDSVDEDDVESGLDLPIKRRRCAQPAKDDQNVDEKASLCSSFNKKPTPYDRREREKEQSQENIFVTETLDKDDPDFLSIQEAMNNTIREHVHQDKISHYSIEKILKIHNKILWDRYVERREEILISHLIETIDVNEKYLFHGTSNENALNIVKNGFLVGKKPGMFGKGIYFANISSKSNQYSLNGLEPCEKHNERMCQECIRSLILGRVTLGKMFAATKASPHAPPEGFDSLYGTPLKNFLRYPEYVVYHKDQVYPEFLIHYKAILEETEEENARSNFDPDDDDTEKDTNSSFESDDTSTNNSSSQNGSTNSTSSNSSLQDGQDLKDSYEEGLTRQKRACLDQLQVQQRLNEKELKPLEKSVQQLTERLKLLRAEAKKKTAGPVGGMKKFIEEEDKHYREIQNNVAELRDIDEKKQKEKFKNDLSLLEQKIISNKERLQELESTTDLDAIKQGLQDLNQQAREVVKDIESIRQKESGKRRLLNDFIQEIRDFEYEIKEQSNLAERRLAELSGLHRLSYNATVYLNNDLRKNHQFAGKVYSSIVLEINTTDPRASRYLNIVISRRDKIAFLCEKSEDFNFLFMHLKQKFGNGLNMLTQGPEVIDLNQPIGMEALRKMGFDDYLSNLIACPTEIYNYLCKTYRLHQIPVAFKDGQVNRQDASQTFNQFFIGDTMYRISTSKYTNEKSSRTIPITNKKNPFDITIDLNAVAQLKAMKDKKVEERDALQREMQEMNAEVDPLQRKQDALRNKMKELRNRESQMNELQSQIRRNESSLETKKQNQGDFDKQKEKILIANQRLLRDAVVKLDDFKKHLKKCYSYDVESGFANMEVRAVSKKHLNKQNKLDEKKRTHKDFLRTYQNVVEAWNRLKSEAARLKAVAEKTIGCTPKDPKFKKMQEIFAKLPATLLELDDMKTDLESRLEFMDSAADENIAELLERQKAKVSEMERQLAFIREQVTGRKTQMDRLKETWLPALEELADRISVKFERLFNYMGCEGTVKLLKGNAETQDDYENYGLSIQVSFRAGESLQELGGTQSGGERSVSTAIYLLALQELTEVPFRCLDEINQGMDATNERRIMELMMKMSGNEDSCQYFLVSPKLLANLVYVNTCRVLCVQQPLRMDTTKWTMAKFILKKQMEVGEKRSRTNGRAQDNDETEDDN
ncbi:structural maintenance of chromosomes protein 5-like [Neocloeon triangulifer]|uniref:structural maintenance of chromosomes protein 5-like n=1 Tax=Neocloeon triangulifer TaxID=2078957 RepID=UPI00286F426D|nr:structural maintenance of chromosomes protein 5-like [Neocloeon triangulifer]